MLLSVDLHGSYDSIHVRGRVEPVPLDKGGVTEQDPPPAFIHQLDDASIVRLTIRLATLSNCDFSIPDCMDMTNQLRELKKMELALERDNPNYRH